MLAGVDKYHINLTSEFIANEIYAEVLDKMDYEPDLIVRKI